VEFLIMACKKNGSFLKRVGNGAYFVNIHQTMYRI
jgi:hypothetical protein